MNNPKSDLALRNRAARVRGFRTGLPGGRRQCPRLWVAGAATALLLVAAGTARAQDAITATLHPSGMVKVSRAGAELATIEMNAHGPNWQHAPQNTASAEVSALPDGGGKQSAGLLAIPGTGGGAIRYTESVKALPQGLQLDYDLTITKTMQLNGLQFSINLPVARYAGKGVEISRPEGAPDIVSLPQEQEKGRFRLWFGQGAKAEVAKGTDDALTLELPAATEVVVQDMRQWGNPVFEVRCPAIMEDGGREVQQGETFGLSLTVTFAGPIRLEGP